MLAGPPAKQVRIRAWIDANRPAVRIEVESREPVHVEAKLEVWRTASRILEGKEADSAYGQDGGPDPIIESADTILPPRDGRIAWFHRNPTSVWLSTIRHQGLAEWQRQASDPILHRTFGGRTRG